MANRVVSRIQKIRNLWKPHRQKRDRVISDVQEIQNRLNQLGTHAVVNVALLSLEKNAFCPEEIRAASIDGVKFTILPDIGEVLRSHAIFDVVLLCCHVRGEESILFDLRQRGVAALYGAWFWDNHHHHQLNLRTAMLADVVFVSHWHERQHLNIPIALAGAHIPAYSRQWSPGAIARYYPGGLPAERRNSLFGGFGRYAWAVERNRFVEALSAAAAENSLTLGKIDDYFQVPFAERLRTWVEHKVQLVVPLNHDVSTRVFESLMTGQIPLVPDDVPDIDRLIDLDTQAILPILRYRAGDVESAKAAWREGIALFDEAGAEGVRRRHEFARDGHNLEARLADFSAFIRRPGLFKLTGNGKVKTWDRWR